MPSTPAVIQALAGLFGLDPHTQAQRLLRLHTPLGPDVLLAERVRITEGIGPCMPLPMQAQATAGAAPAVAPHGLRIELSALSTDGHLELKRLMGQPVVLELLTQISPTPRPWHAHVTEARFAGSDGGLARYELILEPWLAFLAQRRDSWVFQDASVMDIVDEVFGDYQAHGRLAPAWRWELADPQAYPRRSLCIQYEETDLAFIERLLLEEGLFYWFEHNATPGSAEGQHTLVIADHNGAFTPNAQPQVRFTQSDTVFPEDSLQRVGSQARVLASTVQLASRDYRSTSLRPVSAQSTSAAPVPLAIHDVPGQYAYEDTTQGQRLAGVQQQALDSQRRRIHAAGPWRGAQPGSTFSLLGHPGVSAEPLAILSVCHRARNNLSADARAAVQQLNAAIALDQLGPAQRPQANDSADEEPLHWADITLLPAATPHRASFMAASGLPGAAGLPASAHRIPDPRLHPRPTVHGTQTALVVGLGEPIHTDRDHRIKIQFHWQRGTSASHRLGHPSGDNAPASDASGTWVPVAARQFGPVAGANWGAVAAPRLGQEVLVAFIAGDIDRPVVVGSLYNAQGNDNAQGSQRSAGAARSTGNTPAWFPGTQQAGELQGHAHAAVFSGVKTQELSSSATGLGGYNQLVFDDSPGALRLELATSLQHTRLQLGSLIQQQDNQRLQLRGHGIDLATQAWGAVRAGSGLLISTHARPGSSAQARQIDSSEPLAQIDQSRELLHTLAESAQQHQAKGDTAPAAEPDIVGAKDTDEETRKLPNEQALDGLRKSLQNTDSRDDAAGDDSGGSNANGNSSGNGNGNGNGNDTPSPTVAGGAGTITAWTRPDLVLASPAAVSLATPASIVHSAGNTSTLVAGQDITRIAQRHISSVVKGDLTLYTYGRASNGQKPTQQTGIALHAASGSVHTATLKAATHVTADKALDVASTQGQVRATSPKRVLLTAGGAAIEITSGRITLNTTGKVDFKASQKVLTGAGGAGASVALRQAGQLTLCELRATTAAAMNEALVVA